MLVCSRFECLIKKSALIKRETHPQSCQVSWYRDVKLSKQPFSRNSPNSQFAVNSRKSWRTVRPHSVTSKETSRVEKQHSRWPCLSGKQSEPACLGWRRLHMHTWLRWCVVDWGFGLVWFGCCCCFYFVLFCFFNFRDRVSLYRPSYPRNHFEDQAGLELRNLPASASQVLGLKVCTTTAWLVDWFWFVLLNKNLGRCSERRL